MMRRHGVSFVEVLIVICVISLILAVAIPGILALMESARRQKCRMNLRHISTGIKAYYSQYDSFPPAATWNHPGITITQKGFFLPGTIDLVGSDPSYWPNDRFRVGFFMAMLLFFWDGPPPGPNTDIAASNPENEFLRSLNIDIYTCPSDYSTRTKSKLMGGNWARGNYAVNAGPDPPCLRTELQGLGAFSLPSMSCRVWYPGVQGDLGVEISPPSLWSVNEVFGSGVAGINRVFRDRDITDSVAKTIMIEEIIAGTDPMDRRGCWAMPGIGSSITFGHGNWNKAGTPNSPNAVDIIQDGSKSFNPPSDGSYHASLTASPRSRHPGGIHVLFVDGTVSFINDDIDPYVWTALHTRASQDDARTLPE